MIDRPRWRNAYTDVGGYPQCCDAQAVRSMAALIGIPDLYLRPQQRCQFYGFLCAVLVCPVYRYAARLVFEVVLAFLGMVAPPCRVRGWDIHRLSGSGIAARKVFNNLKSRIQCYRAPLVSGNQLLSMNLCVNKLPHYLRRLQTVVSNW